MGKPKAPTPPSPAETAKAQTGTNVVTALANAQLGNVNQYGPDGSVTYTTSGGRNFTDPSSGATYFIPQYEQTTKLSDAQQAIKNQNDTASLNLSKLANEQSAFLGDYLSKPVDLSNDATEERLMELGRKRLDPAIAQRDQDLRTRLANQGIKAGSAAYDREIANFNQGTNDAYNQLILSGRNQAVQEALTQRNQPINEIIGLLDGTQVGVPQFGAGTNQPTLPTVDYAGLVNENYNQKLGIYNQQNAARQNMLGGLFGLGSAFIQASDRRVKKDVKKAGRLMGHNVYEYSYKGKFDDGKKHVGVMAQEVEKKRPDAVATGSDGVKRVHYGRLFGMGERAAA